MNSADPAIEVTDLVKSFGATRAVDGLSLSVPTGSVLGLLGPNGAGKTTTIRMVTTLTTPDSGTVRVFGRDVARDADSVRARLSVTGQFASVDDDLTGWENLVLQARLRGLRGRAVGRARRRAARRLRPRRRRPSGRVDLLRRHATSARHRRRVGRHPGPARARRADDRARPAQPRLRLGHHPCRGRGRHDGPVDDPVPRRGRPALRPDRGHRPRPPRRGGHPGRAQARPRLRSPDRRASTQLGATTPPICSARSSAPPSNRPATRPRCGCASPGTVETPPSE